MRWNAPTLPPTPPPPYRADRSPGSFAVAAATLAVACVIAAIVLVPRQALVPLVSTAFCAMVTATAAPIATRRRLPIVPAFAAQAGQLAWLFFGLLFLKSLAPTAEEAIDLLTAAILESVILFCGLLWLMLRPGVGAVVYLILYQLAGIDYNAWALGTAPAHSPAHGQLIVSVLWRAAAVALLVGGLPWLRRWQPRTLPPGPSA